MTWRARRLDSWTATQAVWVLALTFLVVSGSPAFAQGLGGAGTIQGTVKDPTGGVMQSVDVKISNPVTGFNRTATTDAMGKFVFRNLPPNPYHISVEAQGFQTLERDVNVRTSVPIEADLTLALAGATAAVEVVGHTEELLERDPTAHTDVDQSLIAKLPIESSSGLNQVITLASPGVVADANGFFHPIGDHAQTQFSIDNQPVTDQQSRIYSNQISPEAVQSMEVITGIPPAEFGDKDSLVVRITTKSGLDQKPSGSFSAGYGSFKSPSVEANLGAGNGMAGNFVSVSGLRTDRFLDPPEFEALHDHGTSESLFDRLDLRPSGVDTLHLNLHVGRSSFDVPNTFDQNDGGQAQHQKITTVNIAPGYTRVIGSKVLFAANVYVRRDKVTYTPSADPFADQPGTAAQGRELRNLGVKTDISYTQGAHNLKVGGAVSATKLTENFSLGLTDPTLNDPESEEFIPGLAPFDLTRGGTLFQFHGDATVKEQSFYVQDEIRAGGNTTIKLGLRGDHYDGLTTSTLIQPRLGLSYAVPGSGTILRASYGRTLETPYNENLVLASSADAEVFGTAGKPLPAGKRDHVEVGVQQAFGRWLVADVGYFYKHTTNAYDFGVLFDTPIFFPVAWDHSKIDGFTARVNLVEHGGFSAFTVMGHTNAIFSPPGTGGILLEAPPADFRIDHDQKFQQTTNLQYVFIKPLGAWAALSWRYDSGLVAGAVGSFDDALALTGDQQAAIGLFCGGVVATREAPLSDCDSTDRGAKRLRIPADGTADDVTNPPRIAPRHLLDLGIGVDNLFKSSKAKVRLRFSVMNLTNREALYNFLSTFSGTHFVTPRAYQLQAGVTF
jgi:carboxypeptidase family protein/TonB-dependent receptor-like protein